MKPSQETLSINQSLSDMGFTLTAKGPTAEVKDQWTCISYVVTLSFNGKEVITTPYSLGIGHVDTKHAPHYSTLTDREHSMLLTWQRNPNADFLDKQLQADVACKLAKFQRVTPQLADVLYSLISDGEAYFESMTFADWCANFGYDSDSIKAKKTFDKCDEIGRALKRNLGDSVIRQAQTLLSNY